MIIIENEVRTFEVEADEFLTISLLFPYYFHTISMILPRNNMEFFGFVL